MTNYSIIEIIDMTVLPIKSSNWWESPVMAALLGFLLASLMNWIKDYRKEQKELRNYEFLLLKEIDEILEVRKPDIDNFLAMVYTDLRFTRLESMELITESLKKAKRNEDFSDEKTKIDSRLEKLREGGIVTKLIARSKSMFTKKI